MNKKLNEEQRAWVESAKREISTLQKKQDELFNNLINDLLIVNESDINWIFDFVYNAGELSDEYYKMVESAIFE
jgi:hypothetical protein